MGSVRGDDEAAAAFARDGVACLRRVLDAGEVAAAADAIDAVLAGPGPLAQVASGADGPWAFVEDFCRWREIPQIEQLARYSRVPALAAALMATEQVRFYHDHVLVKEGGTRQHTPWHQDQPYYNVDGRGGHGPPAVPGGLDGLTRPSQPAQPHHARRSGRRRRRSFRVRAKSIRGYPENSGRVNASS
jgi:hypothetical protein